MSREILFRGKTVAGAWVYGGIAFQEDSDVVIVGALDKYQSIYDMGIKSEYVIPETVGQFTGLTDKNGKRIFEGDIHERKNHFFIVKHGEYRDCETNEDGYGWYFKYAHSRDCEGFNGREEEYVNIIGNIHDNPELLKGGEGE